MNTTTPNFIWIDSEGKGRNQVALFRKYFHLTAIPTRADFHIFADTRYRLQVNGQTLGHGPARFHVATPEHDCWDIAPHLVEGANVINVIVHSLLRETFWSEASIGGLVAWGQIDGISLDTDATWKAIAAKGYHTDTTRLSNQAGFHENLDARHLPLGWEQPDFDDSSWVAAVPIANPDHWGVLRPRSIELLDESAVAPATLSGEFSINKSEPEQQVAGLIVNTESDSGWPIFPTPIAFYTHLFSPAVQTITLGTSAPQCWLNGEVIEAMARPDLLWRTDFEITLREGWNSFLALDNRLGDSVEFAFQWPKAANIVVNAECNPHGELSFKIDSNSDLNTLPGLELARDWKTQIAQPQFPSAFATRAWEKLVPVNEKTNSEGDRVFLYDFGGEVLGRPRLEFTSTPGTIVDLLYTEQLADGVAKHGVQNTRMGDRYIAHEGRQTWHALHPRGMRYLELIIRGDHNQFELHDLHVTRANYPVQQIGAFSCSDEKLTKIWQVGVDTLRACMEDAYLDCPWRERGLYLGDLLVQFYTNLASFGDYALLRRCIVQLFETQDVESGLLSCCDHGLDSGVLPDYSAISVQILWHYWARTGDLKFVCGFESKLRNLLRGLRAIEVPGLNLLNVDGHSPYIDLSHTDNSGINCAGNCFQQRAFADGAQIFELFGDAEAAAEYQAHADEMAEAIRLSFWNDEQNVFLDRRLEDEPNTYPSTPGNTLPVLYGTATPEQAERAIAFLVEAAANNERVPNPQETAQLNFTTYFSFYGMAALYENDKVLEVENFIRENWGEMLDAGATTWWEYFIDNWSLCHAWSSGPTHYLSTQVLGVRYAADGVPDEIIIAPRPGSLTWAKGIYPHPRGPIVVEWQKNGEEIEIKYQVPNGIRVKPLP